MALLGTVHDGLSEPFWIHGREQSHEVFLLGLSMALLAPRIWAVSGELLDVLSLHPHIGRGELGPLRDLHRGHLIGPEDILLASQDLMDEAQWAILFFGQENVLKI